VTDDSNGRIAIARLLEWQRYVETRLDTFITKGEFTPVKLIAYGLASSVLLAVIAAILRGVLR